MKRRNFIGLVSATSLARASGLTKGGRVSGAAAVSPWERESAPFDAPSVEPPASREWQREANKIFDEEVALAPRFVDRDSGMPVYRLTYQPCINRHIYPEAPVSTPDGKRFFFFRKRPLDSLTTYWIGDIETLFIRQVTDEAGASAPLVAPDGRWFFYSVGRTIKRLSPETFERQVVFRVPNEIPAFSGVQTIDITGTRLASGVRTALGVPAAAVIDLERGTIKIVYEHPDMVNPHLQYSRNADRKLLIQINNGIRRDKEGNWLTLVGELGASLAVLKDDGSGFTTLKVGFSPVERVQGHQCWVGPRDEVVVATHRRPTPTAAWIQDRLVACVPGEPYRVVAAGEAFTHIHTTPDGEFWISDSNRTSDIFIGSMKSGKYRLFHHSEATFGASNDTHPHPFFLGNGKTVGWNSDKTGIPHVYFARVTREFIDSLRS